MTGSRLCRFKVMMNLHHIIIMLTGIYIIIPLLNGLKTFEDQANTRLMAKPSQTDVLPKNPLIRGISKLC